MFYSQVFTITCRIRSFTDNININLLEDDLVTNNSINLSNAREYLKYIYIHTRIGKIPNFVSENKSHTQSYINHTFVGNKNYLQQSIVCIFQSEITHHFCTVLSLNVDNNEINKTNAVHKVTNFAIMEQFLISEEMIINIVIYRYR